MRSLTASYIPVTAIAVNCLAVSFVVAITIATAIIIIFSLVNHRQLQRLPLLIAIMPTATKTKSFTSLESLSYQIPSVEGDDESTQTSSGIAFILFAVVKSSRRRRRRMLLLKTCRSCCHWYCCLDQIVGLSEHPKPCHSEPRARLSHNPPSTKHSLFYYSF